MLVPVPVLVVCLLRMWASGARPHGMGSSFWEGEVRPSACLSTLR